MATTMTTKLPRAGSGLVSSGSFTTRSKPVSSGSFTKAGFSASKDRRRSSGVASEFFKRFRPPSAQPAGKSKGPSPDRSLTCAAPFGSSHQDIMGDSRSSWLEFQVLEHLNLIETKLDSLLMLERSYGHASNGANLHEGYHAVNGANLPSGLNGATSNPEDPGLLDVMPTKSIANKSQSSAMFSQRSTAPRNGRVPGEGGDAGTVMQKISSICSMNMRSTLSAVSRTEDGRRKTLACYGRQMTRRAEAVWTFLEDPDSSFGAFVYSKLMPALTISSVIISLLQTIRPAPLQGLSAAVIETMFDCIFLLDIGVRSFFYPSYWSFFFEINNLIDIIVGLAIVPRAACGFVLESSDEDTVYYFILLCIVPIFRLLKILRRFEKFHLLMKAVELCAEALPVLLFILVVITLVFSSLIYAVEPRDNIPSYPVAIWLSIVTMTTVGYGDVTPQTGAGHVIVAVLVINSVLYMAMPIGIVGYEFTQVWCDRDRVLLMRRTRDSFVQWGYTAADIKALFHLFDEDQNGELNLEEFSKMIRRMGIGISEARVLELFKVFDTNSLGKISERDFVRVLFPRAFHELYVVRTHLRGSGFKFFNASSRFFGSRQGSKHTEGDEPENLGNVDVVGDLSVSMPTEIEKLGNRENQNDQDLILSNESGQLGTWADFPRQISDSETSSVLQISHPLYLSETTVKDVRDETALNTVREESSCRSKANGARIT